MKKAAAVLAGVLAAAFALAGCNSTSAWETAKEAFQEKDKTAVEKKLLEALEKADEEIAEDPKNVMPYMVKGSVFRIKGQFESAIEAFKSALETAEIANEKQKQALEEYVITCYYRSGEVNMLKAGIEYVKKLISTRGENEYYFYALGCCNLELYNKLGDGFYKSEANRCFQKVDLEREPDILKELNQEGIPDPLLE